MIIENVFFELSIDQKLFKTIVFITLIENFDFRHVFVPQNYEKYLFQKDEVFDSMLSYIYQLVSLDNHRLSYLHKIRLPRCSCSYKLQSTVYKLNPNRQRDLDLREYRDQCRD